MKRIHTETMGDMVAKVYRDSNWDEYRVRLYECGVLLAYADYFTDEKDDAIDTARAMVRAAPVAESWTRDIGDSGLQVSGPGPRSAPVAESWTRDIGDSGLQVSGPVARPALVSDSERFAAMSFQSVANLVLRERADPLDRLKAWEYLNSCADYLACEYWTGLSDTAKSRILGAMALDLSAFGFITGKQESGVAA